MLCAKKGVAPGDLKHGTHRDVVQRQDSLRVAGLAKLGGEIAVVADSVQLFEQLREGVSRIQILAMDVLYVFFYALEGVDAAAGEQISQVAVVENADIGSVNQMDDLKRIAIIIGIAFGISIRQVTFSVAA